MTLTDQTLARSVLSLEGGIARLDVRLPWYRSMPFGCTALAELWIGDHKIDPAQVRWEIGGELLSAASAAESDSLWYLQDAVILSFPLDAADLGAAGSVDVRIDFLITVGYLAPGVPPQMHVGVRASVALRLSGA